MEAKRRTLLIAGTIAYLIAGAWLISLLNGSFQVGNTPWWGVATFVIPLEFLLVSPLAILTTRSRIALWKSAILVVLAYCMTVITMIFFMFIRQPLATGIVLTPAYFLLNCYMWIVWHPTGPFFLLAVLIVSSVRRRKNTSISTSSRPSRLTALPAMLLIALTMYWFNYWTSVGMGSQRGWFEIGWIVVGVLLVALAIALRLWNASILFGSFTIVVSTMLVMLSADRASVGFPSGRPQHWLELAIYAMLVLATATLPLLVFILVPFRHDNRGVQAPSKRSTLLLSLAATAVGVVTLLFHSDVLFTLVNPRLVQLHVLAKETVFRNRDFVVGLDHAVWLTGNDGIVDAELWNYATGGGYGVSDTSPLRDMASFHDGAVVILTDRGLFVHSARAARLRKAYFAKEPSGMVLMKTPQGGRLYPERFATRPAHVAGSDVNDLWVTLPAERAVLKIAPGSRPVRVTTPGNPDAITVDRNGCAWFTQPKQNAIASACGNDVRNYSLPSLRASPREIVSKADGTIWFAEPNVNKIGVRGTDGRIQEFSLPKTSSDPKYMVAAGDLVWFTELPVGKVASIDGDGRINEYQPWLAYPSRPQLTRGADGRVWFMEPGSQANRGVPDGALGVLVPPRRR